MRVLKVFIITFVLAFAAQVILDLPTVQNYIKREIRAAKLINVTIKYVAKPEGLST